MGGADGGGVLWGPGDVFACAARVWTYHLALLPILSQALSTTVTGLLGDMIAQVVCYPQALAAVPVGCTNRPPFRLDARRAAAVEALNSVYLAQREEKTLRPLNSPERGLMLMLYKRTVSISLPGSCLRGALSQLYDRRTTHFTSTAQIPTHDSPTHGLSTPTSKQCACGYQLHSTKPENAHQRPLRLYRSPVAIGNFRLDLGNLWTIFRITTVVVIRLPTEGTFSSLRSS